MAKMEGINHHLMDFDRREILLAIVVFGGIFLMAALLEPRLFAFERGSHFSWVTLHSLAIARHSTAEPGWPRVFQVATSMPVIATSMCQLQYTENTR